MLDVLDLVEDLGIDYSDSSEDENDKKDPISKYSPEFQKAFLKNLDIFTEIKLSEDNYQQEIEYLAESHCFFTESFTEPIELESSTEMNIVNQKLIRMLEYSISFKVFLASNDTYLFQKYFPYLRKYLHIFFIENVNISSVLNGTFPCLKTSGSFHWQNYSYMLKIIDSALYLLKEYKYHERRHAAELDLIIRTLVSHWKATSFSSLELILNTVDRFNRFYGNLKLFYNPELHLINLLDDYPKNSVDFVEMIFRKALEENPTATPREIIEYFSNNALPSIIAFKNMRQEKHIEVPKSTHAKIEALLKKADCYDDFWEVYVIPEKTEEPSQKEPKNLSAQKKEPKILPPAEETLAVKMSTLLLQNPDLCSNCLESHKLSQCTNLKNDSRKNIAAYFVPDYEAQTNRKRMPFLVNCSKRLAKNRPKVPQPKVPKAKVPSVKVPQPKVPKAKVPMVKVKSKAELPKPPPAKAIQKPPKTEPFLLNLITNNNVDITEVQQEFIISFSAKATVTYKREFISSPKPCTDIIFEDEDGIKHQSQEKGTFEIGGVTIPCYWAPTFDMNVISFTDIRQSADTSMISKDGGVLVCPEGSTELKRIGEGIYDHLFWTHDLTGKDRGVQFKVVSNI